ncbi:MAG: hypothetical protein QM820_39640 [Minicystis sp.]
MKPTDFASDQDVRWCPGCGDYSILAQMKKVHADARHPAREDRVHLRHRLLQPLPVLHEHLRHPLDPRPCAGRCHRPESRAPRPAGLGHHRRRRRPLDRRQPPDARHPPQPRHQHHPLQQPHLWPHQGTILAHVAAGQEDQEHADGRDRQSAPPAVDRDRLRSDVRRPLHRYRTSSTSAKCSSGAAEHQGASFVEVYQNCNVFNDGAWDYAKERDTKADTTLELEHGKPLIFGKNRDKGIRLNGMEPEVVELGKGITEDDLLFHDEKSPEPSLAYLLSRMRYEDGFPEPIGVFRCRRAPAV